jgi:6-pyruvoyltetrahydropterin/6-carboxytetrahydropterin synthase
MYQLAAIRDFIARHYLIGGDWGRENHEHAHHYRLELILQANALDEHGYLIDLVDVEAALERRVEQFRDKLLNTCPEFCQPALNPSLERFAKIFADALSGDLRRPGLQSVEVRLWEHERAWAHYRVDL